MSALCCVLHRLIKRRWCSKSSVRAGASSVCMSCGAALAPAAAPMLTCARAQLISARVPSINYMLTFLWDQPELSQLKTEQSEQANSC